MKVMIKTSLELENIKLLTSVFPLLAEVGGLEALFFLRGSRVGFRGGVLLPHFDSIVSINDTTYNIPSIESPF